MKGLSARLDRLEQVAPSTRYIFWEEGEAKSEAIARATAHRPLGANEDICLITWDVRHEVH